MSCDGVCQVMGHSAGEVASAYASGFLTLEEAVTVVYHRTQEQQKLAGCGRLLAVGLGAEGVASLQLPASVEVACWNSPASSVLAGSEEDLTRIKNSLPGDVLASFVPGNIAFHSSRVEPALPAIAQRLAFLDQRTDRSAWRAAFISTVTGEQEHSLPASYWCDNVRQPVHLQRAVQHLFSEDGEAPDLVLELGPHRTLLGPIKQSLTACLGADAAQDVPLLSTLQRGEQCASVVTGLLAGLFAERGLGVRFHPLFESLDFRLSSGLPKHPFLKKRMHPLLPVYPSDTENGLYSAGPVAGSRLPEDGCWAVELSDRTMKPLADHVMGGNKIAPGMFYVEMALEAVGLPCTLTNVEFKSMCKIPAAASEGEAPTTVLLSLRPSEGVDHSSAFLVKSHPTFVRAEARHSPPDLTEHCTGYVIKDPDPAETAAALIQGSNMRPGAFGLMTPMDLTDIGKDGACLPITDSSGGLLLLPAHAPPADCQPTTDGRHANSD